MSRRQNQRGFTVAEFLVLGGVIVMLVIIMTPIVRDYIEQSRESADFINARTAYAGVMDAAAGEDRETTYAGQTVWQPDGIYQAVVQPLSQEMDGWSTKIEKIRIGDVWGNDWLGRPRAGGSCVITYFPEKDETQLMWGNRYFGLTLMEQHKIDDNLRIQEDQKTLRELGEVILDQAWTPEQLKTFLELPKSGDKDKAHENDVKIAEYDQLKTGSLTDFYESAGCRITAKAGGQLNYLLDKSYYMTGKSKEKTNKEKTLTYYTNRYSLFFSDELATNHYHSYDIKETKRAIFITDMETNKKGKIKKFTIYVDSLKNQARLGKTAKEKFRLEIK